MIDSGIMKQKAEKYGIILTSGQLQMLDCYAEMLVDWNTRMNLTGIVDSEGIMTRHFEDSIAMLYYVDIPVGSSLIDVGTGAGFPGMVLKIVRPDLSVTLLDSLNKRILFLDEVAKAIGAEVHTIHLRAEDGGRMPEYRERYDLACARAVSNLRELAEFCMPYVRPGGKFVSMKGPDSEQELDAARPAIGTLGGKIAGVNNYCISDGSGRTIIAVEKIRTTPSQFPRPSAKIKKKPL